MKQSNMSEHVKADLKKSKAESDHYNNTMMFQDNKSVLKSIISSDPLYTSYMN